MRLEQKVHIADGISLAAGLWLVVAPFVFGYTMTVAATNDIILGLAIGAIALYRVLYPASEPRISWINIVLAAWLIVSAFVLPGRTMTTVWNNIIFGILVIITDSWSSSAAFRGRGAH